MRFAQVRLNLERSFRRCLRFLQTRGALVIAEPKHFRVQTRRQRIGEGKPRVALDRLIDQAKRIRSLVLRVTSAGPMKQFAGAQEEFISENVVCGMRL